MQQERGEVRLGMAVGLHGMPLATLNLMLSVTQTDKNHSKISESSIHGALLWKKVFCGL